MSMKMMQIKEMENGYGSDSAIFLERTEKERNSVVLFVREVLERESEDDERKR